jgi:glc operon protein GlcG
MKLYTGLLAAAAATALAGAAWAADSPFVVSGEMANKILEQNTINVDTAQKLADACIDEAKKQGVQVSVAIYDQFGEPVLIKRMDGQGKVAVDTASMKARTVLNTRAPSKRTMNQVLQGNSSELRQYSFGNFANAGGLPIIINGNQFIGAIGVGGSAPKPPVWSDEICAWRALTKVIGPQPPLLPDVQRQSNAAGGAGNRGNGAPSR